MNDTGRQERLDAISVIATRLEEQTLVPAKLTVAIWAVESQWGLTPVGRANYFGIKRADRHAMWCFSPTHEIFTQGQIDAWNRAHPDHPCRDVKPLASGRFNVVIDDEFADYPSIEDSARDFAWLVSQGPPYRLAFSHYVLDRDFNAYVKAVIVLDHYATSGYGELALEIAAQSNVNEALMAAAKTPQPSVPETPTPA
jgi:flagellum-specific peptidoglycan hydrolase FlgJ